VLCFNKFYLNSILTKTKHFNMVDFVFKSLLDIIILFGSMLNL